MLWTTSRVGSECFGQGSPYAAANLLTTLLTRAEVFRHTEALTLLHELRAALARGGEGTSHQSSGGDAGLRQATHPSCPARAVTVVTPGRSLLHLYDAESGALWAVMDALALFTLRAGMAQPPSGMNTLFIGAGPPWLDLLAAWHVYQGAQGDDALTRLDFEA